MVQIYVAGICNIGPDEIKRRRNTGWAGLAIAAVVLLVLVEAGVGPLWRLLIFLPAALSASGFLQAYFQFCSGFARHGVFNFGVVGQVEQVQDDASKKKDRRKANWLTLFAVLIGAAVAVVSVFV